MDRKAPGEVINDISAYFGFDERIHAAPLNSAMAPAFEQVVLEEDEDNITYVRGDGKTVKTRRDGSSMPMFQRYLVRLETARSDFERFAKRFDADTPDRYITPLDVYTKFYENRSFPLQLGGGGPTLGGSMTRFGIIGCGGISRWHINALSGLPSVKLAAVCDEMPEKSGAVGGELGVASFTDADELMRSGLVDAVSICVPSGLHSGLCVKALRLGLHVAVEKPLAITREGLREVAEAEACSEGKLMSIAQLRYGEDVKRVKAMLDGGALGRITMVDLSMKYYRAPAYYEQVPWRGTLSMDGGGALMNQGIHGIDLLCWLCGGIRQVCCYSGALMHDIEAEDTLAASFTLSGGGMGALTAATSCYPGHERRLEICGTEGSLRLAEDTLVHMELKSGERYESVRDQAGGASDPYAINYELHKRQLGDFAACIQSGAPSPLGAAEASMALNMIFSLYESAAQNAPVAVS